MKRLNKHVRLLLVLMLTLAMLMGTAVTASARGKADSDPPTTEATEPAKKETEGAKGRDSEESDAEKEKSDSEEDEEEDGKDEEETNVILIIAIAAAAAAAAAGTVVLLQKRKRDQYSGYDGYSGDFSGGGYAGGGYSGGGYSGGMVEEDKPTDIWNPNTAPAFDVQIPNNFGMQQSAQAYVCFESGALAGKRFPLGAKVSSVGRDPAADISFPPETRGVSRKHCQLFVKNGTVMVVDVGSSSGTFVSSKGRIPPNTPVPLQPQDTVYLGGKLETLRIKQ